MCRVSGGKWCFIQIVWANRGRRFVIAEVDSDNVAGGVFEEKEVYHQDLVG